MRSFVRTEIPRDFDPRLVNVLRNLHGYLEQVDKGFGRIQRGEKPVAGGALPSQQLIDESKFVLLAGRNSGQAIKGSPASIGSTGVTVLSLLAYNDPSAANIVLNNDDIVIEAATVTMRAPGHDDEPLLMGFSTSGSPVQNWVGLALTGNILINASSASANGFALNHGNMPTTNVTAFVQKRASQTGNLFEWRSAGSPMSYIRASDGAFVGPMVGAGTDQHTDNIFQILGSVDPTKIVMFEVDGLTTATTRTLTVPDVSATLLLTQGISSGQVIGVGAHTGGTASSLVIEGALMFGNFLSGVNFTSGRALDVRHTIVNGAVLVNIQPDVTALSGTASGALTALQAQMTGNPGYTAGSYIARGFNFVMTQGVPAGVTLIEGLGALVQASPSILSATGVITKITGLRAIALGPTGTTSSTDLNELIGFESALSNRFQATNSFFGFKAVAGTGSIIGAVTTAVAYEVNSTFGASANVVTWIGLRIPAISGPGTIWGLDVVPNNRLSGLTQFGSTATPTAFVTLAAGTTTLSPLRLTSGTSLTTALAGVIEMTTDDLFFTITTGAARKAFVLDDGARLTLGRVPFATTNGRLIDDADFTFITDTLTITKIAATTLIGLLTFADAIDIAFNGTTGTKLGTATNQKLGFWNTAPIIQPTTAGAAATFVTNTSLIANDSATWDGYTIGQVVRALRTVGLLA